jgi:CheY-like chemotaxis protein
MFSKFYDVRTAESGEEALEILKNGFKAEVILSDQRMPA